MWFALFGATVIQSISTVSSAPTELWVAKPESGAVTNAQAVRGSRDNPFANLVEARDAIRSRGLNLAMTDDVIVQILPGEYCHTTGAMSGSLAKVASVDFGPQDSGSNGYYVIYRAAEGPGTVTITGAQRMTGWQPDTGGRWKIPAGVFAGEAGINVLYENGKFAWPARKPNLEKKSRYPQFHGGYFNAEDGGFDTSNGQDWIRSKVGDFTTNDFSAPLAPTAELVWWNYGDTQYNQTWSHDWGMDRPCRLLTVDASQRRFAFVDDNPQARPGTGERYFVQGVQSLLDVKGEYFHDVPAGMLYYYPQNGTNPNQQDIRVPTTKRVLNVVGSRPNPATVVPVHHLKFEGLTFAYTNIEYPRAVADGAMSMQWSHHVEVNNCQMFCAATNGAYMQDHNRYNVINGCWIHHCGTGGILIQNLLNRVTSPGLPSEHHRVENCRIHDVGEISTYAVSTAGVALFNTNDCEVSHCDIFNSPRYAVTVRGHWSTEFVGTTPLHLDGTLAAHDRGTYKSRDNILHHIRATDCVTDSGDAGILHAAHVNGDTDPGGMLNINTWRQFLVSGGYADPSMKDIKPNGVFFDHPRSTLGQKLEHIRVTFTGSDVSNVSTGNDAYRGNVNPDSDQALVNVSWKPGYDESAIDFETIGIRAEFPAAFDDQREKVVDDHTSEYSESGGAWTTSAVSEFTKGDNRHRQGGSTPTYAEWRPVLPRKGGYAVDYWKVGHAALNPAAPFEVFHRGGPYSGTVDLSATGTNFVTVGWQSVGEFPFEGGRPADSGYARLKPGVSSSYGVRADALRFRLAYTGLGDESGWWRFEGGLVDASGYGQSGVLQGGAQVTAQARGNSGGLALDGDGDFVEIADSARLDIGTGDFAVSVWFFREANSAGNLRMLSKGAGDDSKKGYALFASENQVTAIVGNGATRLAVAGAFAGLNKWHHVVLNMKRDGAMTLYVNGIKAGAGASLTPFAGADLSSDFALTLGKNVNGTQYWPGKIDDVRIYQRALTDAEISALANPFWWKFDNSAMDVAGYGYQAVLKNGAGYVRHPGGTIGALGLDGLKGYAEVAHDPELDMGLGDFAISTWFYRLPSPQGNLRLLSKGAGLDNNPGYCVLGSNHSLKVFLGNGSSRIDSGEVAFGGLYQWHHLTVNFQRGGAMSVYLDGILKSTKPISSFAGTDIRNTQSLLMGGNSNSYSELWPGRADEVRLFKRTLSQGEITVLAATPPDVAARTAPSVVAALSRHDHGGRMEDLVLYDREEAVSNVEPRRDAVTGGKHTILVQFDQAVQGGQAAVVGGSATVESLTTGSHTVTVTLKDVVDRQKVVLRVWNVQGLHGLPMATTDLSIRFLAGDANRDGSVTLSPDVEAYQDYQTRPETRNETNRVTLDTVADGLVDSADWVLMGNNVGQSVSP